MILLMLPYCNHHGSRALIVFMATDLARNVKKRNDLSLQQKVSVIKASEPKPSIRKLAEEFNCGKTQISTILQNKHEILDMYDWRDLPHKKTN